MGLMAQVVDRVGIMYAGDLAEVSPVDDLFRSPLHPYSQLLIASLPSLEEKGSFQGIPGLPPSLLNRPTGCPFRTRCPYAMERCAVEFPWPREVEPKRRVACHLY
jgi:peptide/nickel transport system ATP-binding protein